MRLLGPGFLRERRVHRDAVDHSVQRSIVAHRGRDVAELSGAHASERKGHKEQDGLGLAEVVAQLQLVSAQRL